MAEKKVYTPDKSFSLYNGKINIDFYEQNGRYKHVYIIRETEEWPISVTKATGMIDKSAALMAWQKKLIKERLLLALSNKESFTEELILISVERADEEKAKGQDNGTIVHDYIEAFIKGQKPEMPKDEKALNGITAFHSMVKEWEMEFIESESIVYSKKHQYVGKLDVNIKCKIPGHGNKKLICLGDFKTNNWKLNKKTGIRESILYPEQRYQIAAYQQAREEERPGYYTGPRLMFALDKVTGDFHVHNLDEEEKNYKKDCAAFLAALTLKKREKELSTWGD